MKREVQDALKEAGVSSWISERVFTFMTPFLPVMKSKKTGIYGLQDETLSSKPISELSDAFQEFYEELEQEIRNVRGTPKKSDDALSTQTGGDVIEREKSHNGALKVREIMEAVEKVICTTVSDRLLRPDTSDDAQHDEALASRIAALNLLDLTPEHLGVDVGNNDRALAELVSQCGKGLRHHTFIEKTKTLMSWHAQCL